jgi:hypothetical protein
MTRLLGLPFLAVALLFGYEWGALTFGLPTLSQMVSAHISRQPALGAVEGFVAGVVISMLVMHFAGVLPWWRP